jgi:hypothetical protein
MIRPDGILLRVASVVLVMLAGACSDREPTRASGDEIQTHTPALRSARVDAVIAASPAYTQLDDASKRGTEGSLHLSVDAAGDIPRHPDAFINSVAVFGYAWVDGQMSRGVGAVIHPSIGRDSRQNPDGWHTHPVSLLPGTQASTFCIGSIGRSQGGIAIHDDVLRLQMSERWAGITAAELDLAASFIVQADAGCGVGLGVVVLDAEPLDSEPT